MEQATLTIVVSAIVGSAGLQGTWAALEAGKTVALANKESLVVAGPLVTRLAREQRATILPVDSEHSAVFQALQAGRREEVRRVVLTASGGPFRTCRRSSLPSVTVAEALAHPTWEMGPKVTIDSATLMNKALEIIEARWLFDLAPDQIGVVIHPQSIVHSLVEYIDGSVVAQMSPPDMKLPIQYALTWPQRRRGGGGEARLEPGDAVWTSSRPTSSGFGALRLGLEAARGRRHGRGRAERRERGGRGGVPGRRAGFSRDRARLPERFGTSRFRSQSHAWNSCSPWTVGLVRRYHVGFALDRFRLDPWPASRDSSWHMVVILVILGLSMVIFVHELGHFLVAKLCGVKCEKFYIWFDVFG